MSAAGSGGVSGEAMTDPLAKLLHGDCRAVLVGMEGMA